MTARGAVTIPAMTSRDFAALWSRCHPGVPPLGWRLRVRYPERWLRVYSLPGGKRYPDAPAEWDELLARHDAVLDAVLAPHAPAEVVVGLYGDEDRAVREAVAALGAAPLPRAFPTDDEDAGLRLLHAPLAWRPGRLEAVVRAVASDALQVLTVVDPVSCAAVCPYDGGVDLVAASAADRVALRARFAAWASPRADGL